MKTATLSIRVDPEVKAAAERTFAPLGLSIAEAVIIFLHKPECTDRRRRERHCGGAMDRRVA
ncbi:MAG: hypothetical protein FWF43_05100 [Propionibacteriaceae bacterium]|nr:hypothetical protein [Propionibacteriaceae bacterium]